jgi:hypothetical protein
MFLQPQQAEVLLSFHPLPLLVGVVEVIKEDTILVQAQPEVLVVQVVVELLGEGLTPVALGTLHLYPHLREAMVAMVLKAPQQILLGVAEVVQTAPEERAYQTKVVPVVQALHLLLAAHP